MKLFRDKRQEQQVQETQRALDAKTRLVDEHANYIAQLLSDLELAKMARASADEERVLAEGRLASVLEMHSQETLVATIQIDPQEIVDILKVIDPTIRVDWVGWKLHVYSANADFKDPGIRMPILNAVEARLHALVSVFRT